MGSQRETGVVEVEARTQGAYGELPAGNVDLRERRYCPSYK